MKKYRYSLIAITGLIASGCASTQHDINERLDVVRHGLGPSMFDGVEFWEYRAPTHKYRFIGIIDDERLGVIPMMADLPRDIAEKVKMQGGDGVIILSKGTENRGSYTDSKVSAQLAANPAYAGRSAVSVPVTWNRTRFGVIKYSDANQRVEQDGRGQPATRSESR